jgi:DNA-binding LacI/PurR family transcriptional regulator
LALSLKRSSLVAQVAEAVRAEIFRGGWTEWIPSERELSELLHVSRNTCSAALHTLYREKLIEPIRGRGIRLNPAAVRKARSEGQHTRSVGIIIPEALGSLRPSNSLLIEELQAELFDLGVRLQLHNSPVYYRANPHHALEKLVEKNHHDCWILMLSHRAMQSWFMKRGLPCVVSGSVYSDIQLPFVDYDHRAVCRHAAGKLIALGHRRIVLFNRRLRAAGDLETEAGLFEGVRVSSHQHVEASVVYHEDSMQSVSFLVNRLFSSPLPPTGIIVANSYCYLSVMSTLARSGYRVPADVSLISRDDDHYLAYLDPEPARYIYDGAGITRRMMGLIRSMLEGGAARMDTSRMAARFVPGGSLRKL